MARVIRLDVGADYQGKVDAAPEGARFLFAAGVHRLTEPIEPKSGQSFAGAEGAVLSGAREVGAFGRAGELFVLEGQTQQGERHATEEATPGAVRAGFPDTVFLDDRPLSPVASRDAVEPGAFYFDYRADRIYLADDPTGRKLEVGIARAAFDGDARDVRVSGLVVEKFSAPVQRCAIEGGVRWIVEDNEVRLNYGVGVTVGAGGRIVGNDVHDNGQMGLTADGAGVLVEGNTIHANGFWSGIDQFWEGGGAKFAETTGLVVRGNYSHSNHGFGLWTDIDNRDTLYLGNLVVGNDGGGITHEISYDAVIRDNILIGNGSDPQGEWLWGGAIQIQNSQDVTIIGNRIDMSGGLNGVALIQQDRGSGAFGPWVTTGNEVRGNVLVSDSRDGASGGAADHDEAGLLAGGNVFAGNRYYMPDGDHWWWGEFPGGEGWTAYRSGAGQDAGSTLRRGMVDVAAWMRSSPLTDGDDALRGGGARDLLVGGGGDDTLTGRGAADRLLGDAGSDRLYGGDGGDRLHGGAGRDKLDGGDGGDRLGGGAGRDRLMGGDGSDVFVFSGGRDQIVDFRSGQDDRIDVSGVDADAARRGDQAFEFIGRAGFSGAGGEIRVASSGRDTRVTADLDGDATADLAIEIRGRLGLEAGDFLL